VTEICKCSELAKPVRRSEKKFLNELMREVRYPQKVKVQEPCHKAYVLLLSAIDKAEIPEFSLRVEQSEIVEQCVRILSALFDNALEREKGMLLESCILFKRALMLQMWDDIGPHRSIFELTPKLPTALIPRFIECGLNSITDFLSHAPNDLQGILRCSLADLRNLQAFTKTIQQSKLEVEILDVHDDQIHLKVHPLVEIENIEPNASNLQPRIFHLICYDSESSLVCYRRLHSVATTVEYQIHCNKIVSVESLWVLLLCEDMIGLDYKIIPRSFSTPQPETRIRRVGEFSLAAARNLEQDYPNLSPKKAPGPIESKKSKKQKTLTQTSLKSSPFFKDSRDPPPKKKPNKSAETLSGFGIFAYDPNQGSDLASSVGKGTRVVSNNPSEMEIPTDVSQPFFERQSNEMKLLKSKGREFESTYSPIKTIRSRVIHPPSIAVPPVRQETLSLNPTQGSPCIESSPPIVRGTFFRSSNERRETALSPPLSPPPPPSTQQDDLFDRGFF
jgi:hypothetical protein